MSTKEQAGFTLVELLTSMLIGLFLLGALVTMMMSSQTTSQLRQAMGNTGTDLSAAATYLESFLQKAGYPNDAFVMDGGIVGTGTTGAVVNIKSAPEDDADWDSTTTDANGIVFQYQAFEDTTDCHGDPVSEGDFVSSRFAFDTDADDANYLELRCYGKTGHTVIIRGLKTNSNFLLGEDLNANGTIDQYVTSSSVLSMKQVIGVQFNLIASLDYTNSDDGIIKGDGDEAAATDSDIVYTLNIHLRNTVSKARNIF